MDEQHKQKELEDEKMINEAFQKLIDTYLASKHRKKIEIITKAFNFAKQAHKGVRRRSGEPYIMHPLAVAQIVCQEIGLGSTSICSALLHDVVEDTAVTMEELATEFPPEVIDVLKLLTHREGVPYFDYVRNIKANPIAVKVKLADLAHNGDQSRCVGSDVSAQRMAARKEKYARAKAILTEE